MCCLISMCFCFLKFFFFCNWYLSHSIVVIEDAWHDFIFLYLPRFGLWSKMWSHLESVSCALEKKVYPSAFGWNVLKISMKSILSNISFKTCVSLFLFCFNDLFIGVSGVLQSPTIIVLLSISPFMFVSVHLMYWCWVLYSGGFLCMSSHYLYSLELVLWYSRVLESVLPIQRLRGLISGQEQRFHKWFVMELSETKTNTEKQESKDAAAAAKLCQLYPTLFNPKDSSPTGSSVPGILQSRILEWVAISFCSAWKWKVKVKSFSRVRLLATPWTLAYQTPPSMGFSRQEYWSGLPLPSPK